MTLEEFRLSLIGSVEKFVKDWESSQVDNPDMFPDSMNEADWDEQFLFFRSCEGDEV